MQDRIRLRSLALLVCCSAAIAAPGASLVGLGDSSASASSSYNTDRYPKFAVNGAGLYGGTHTNGSANGTMWMSVSGSPAGQWFKVDLGAAYPLHSLKLWNFNWSGYVQRGVKQCDIYVSASETDPGSTFPGAWTLAKADHVFAQASGLATYAGDAPVSLLGHTARWVALRVDSGYDSQYVGIAELQVFATDAPKVSILPPTVASAAEALVNGTLVHDGGQPTTVYAHWGTADGGQDATAWQATTNLGTQAVGPLGVAVPVAADTGYVCRLSAVNDDGTNWSAAAAFVTASVSMAAPATLDEGDIALPLEFARPAGCDNVDLPILYAVVGGTAVAGVDYVAPTAPCVLPAGSASATASITLLDDVTQETDKTIVVAITSGVSIASAASTNSVVVRDDDSPIDESAWTHHMNVVLSGYAGVTPLTNFPCAVRLHEDMPGFLYSRFRQPADGGDLRVTVPGTGQLLAHEFDTWDTNGTSVVWVRVPVLSGTGTTLRLHWGNADAKLRGYSLSGAVWSEFFGGVWHLGSPEPADASGMGNHGSGHMIATTNGVLGSAQQFDGTAAYIEVPDAPSIGSQARASLTVSMWLSPDVDLLTGDDIRMLEKGDDYFILQRNSAPLSMLVKTNNVALEVGASATVPAGAWRHVCGTYDGANLRLYVDGSVQSTKPLTGLLDDDHLPLRIGSSDDGKYFGGKLDEVRISRVARSADWVRASFDNQHLGSTFATYGAVETVPGTLITLW